MNIWEHTIDQYKNYPSQLPLERENSLPPEASTVVDKQVSINQEPLIVSKLNLSPLFKMNPALEVKAIAVDRYIRAQMQKEGLSDTEVAYMQVLNRYFLGDTESLEQSVRSGKSDKVIERIFRELALHNKKSSATFVKQMTLQVKKEKVAQAIKDLKDTLATLV